MKQAAREIVWMLLACGIALVIFRHVSLLREPLPEQAFEAIRNGLFLVAGYLLARAVTALTAPPP